jgi:ankyrin repeat protein
MPTATQRTKKHASEPSKVSRELLREMGSLEAPIIELNIGAIRLLLKKGADVNVRTEGGSTPLMIASRDIRLDVVKLLLDNYADVNATDKEGETALMEVCNFDGTVGARGDRTTQQIAIAKLLLAKGAKIDAKDKKGRTALMRAAGQQGSINITKVLIEGGADINARDNEGLTALNQAEFFDMPAAKLLKEHGAISAKLR